MKVRTLPLLLSLALVALLLGAPSGDAPSAVAEDDHEGAKLLVKIDPKHAQDLADWADERGGVVLELEEMRRIHPRDKSGESSPSANQERKVPQLASARELLAHVNAAIDEVRKGRSAESIVVTGVWIRETRLTVTASLKEAGTANGIRDALAGLAAIKSRVLEGGPVVEVGKPKKLPDSRTEVSFDARFVSRYVAGKLVEPVRKGPMLALIERAASANQVLVARTSPERVDRHRSAGVVLRYRDLFLRMTDTARLGKFLDALEEGGTTVIQLSYSLAPEKDQSERPEGAAPAITRPMLRVAVTIPLER